MVKEAIFVSSILLSLKFTSSWIYILELLILHFSPLKLTNEPVTLLIWQSLKLPYILILSILSAVIFESIILTFSGIVFTCVSIIFLLFILNSASLFFDVIAILQLL